MPRLDAQGRLDLRETGGNMARDFGIASVVAAGGVAGVIYWVVLFRGGVAPAYANPRIKLGAAACVLLPAMLPGLLRKMLYPMGLGICGFVLWLAVMAHRLGVW